MQVEIRLAFDEAVMAAALPTRKAAAKMLQLLHALDLPQLWSHPVLNFEKLHGMIEPTSGEQLYYLRVGGPAHAIVCLRQGRRPWRWSACMCSTTRHIGGDAPSSPLLFHSNRSLPV